MIRQPHSASREKIVADAIAEVVAELRMVDVADYVAFIRLEHFANVADIVDSAAELYFMPGTVRLGHGAEAHLTWTGEPRIVLDLELKPAGVTVYFKLTLDAGRVGGEIGYVAFDDASPEPEANTAFLERALSDARIKALAAE